MGVGAYFVFSFAIALLASYRLVTRAKPKVILRAAIIVFVLLIGFSLVVSKLKSTESGVFLLLGMGVLLVGPIVGATLGTFVGAIMRPPRTARTVDENAE